MNRKLPKLRITQFMPDFPVEYDENGVAKSALTDQAEIIMTEEMGQPNGSGSVDR